MDEGNAEQSDKDVSKKRSRGPTLCTNLKRRITNQNLECSISFNEYGDPIGDMLQDFRSYIGSVVRFQVDINIESWEVVDQGLKDAIWDDIKVLSKLYIITNIFADLFSVETYYTLLITIPIHISESCNLLSVYTDDYS